MSCISRIFWKLGFALLLLNGYCCKAAENVIGTVINVRGTWRINGHEAALSPGGGVPAGASISADGSSSGGFIVVVLSDKTLLTASCSEIHCRASLTVPKTNASSDSVFTQMIAAVKFVLFNEKAQMDAAYKSTSSRANKSRRSEIIVPFDEAHQIVLVKPEGSKRFSLTRVSDGKPILSQDLASDPAGKDVKIAMQSEGFYVVSFSDRFRQETENVFLTIASPAAYASFQSSYDQARTASTAWDDDSAHLFIRAYLISLVQRRQ